MLLIIGEEGFKNLHKAGCIQTMCDVYESADEACEKAYERFAGLMTLCNLDPCTTGCPEYKGGKCKAYQMYSSAAREDAARKRAKIQEATVPNNGPFESMPVKQIAKKYGVSIGEVRRLKAAGKLGLLLEKETKDGLE